MRSDCYNTLYGDTRVFYVISREISGVSGYVKGQGQGHQKQEIHWLSRNFWTGCHRDFWLVASCSLLKVAFVRQSQKLWHNILPNKSNNNNVWYRPTSKFMPVLTRTASLDILWMVFVYHQNCYTHYNISKSGTLIWIPFKNIFSIIWNIQSWKLNDINNQ